MDLAKDEVDKVLTRPGFYGEEEIIVASASKVVANYLVVVTEGVSPVAPVSIT